MWSFSRGPGPDGACESLAHKAPTGPGRRGSNRQARSESGNLLLEFAPRGIRCKSGLGFGEAAKCARTNIRRETSLDVWVGGSSGKVSFLLESFSFRPFGAKTLVALAPLELEFV